MSDQVTESQVKLELIVEHPASQIVKVGGLHEDRFAVP
jgi:hypothetical protein